MNTNQNRIAVRLWKYRHRAAYFRATKARRERDKLTVMKHYSNNDEPFCYRCNFKDIRALSIDHIKGGGGLHKEKLGKKGGRQFYRWLINNNFPNGYQVLCFNCQWIKRAENGEARGRSQLTTEELKAKIVKLEALQR